MSTLKEHVDGPLVERLADVLRTARPAFRHDAFVRAASDGLETRQLKERVSHIADALQDHLPDDVPTTVATIDGAIATGRLDGWSAWPLTELAGRLGPRDPEQVLPLLARLTTVMGCEFAIRPCLAAHPELTFAHLERWADDPDERVRRLVSEGTRPRLPWGERLTALQADPSPSIRLLDRLREDPSETVRRSVANHLGDIAKDHPALALTTARRWREEGGDHVDEVVRHGLRALVKAGNPDALRLLGYDVDAPVRLLSFTAEPTQLPIGGTVHLSAVLTVEGTAPVPVVVEYVVTFLGPRGYRRTGGSWPHARSSSPTEPSAPPVRHPCLPPSPRLATSVRAALDDQPIPAGVGAVGQTDHVGEASVRGVEGRLERDEATGVAVGEPVRVGTLERPGSEVPVLFPLSHAHVETSSSPFATRPRGQPPERITRPLARDQQDVAGQKPGVTTGDGDLVPTDEGGDDGALGEGQIREAPAGDDQILGHVELDEVDLDPVERHGLGHRRPGRLGLCETEAADQW